MTTGKNIPNWNVSGDWFDVCKCNIPCPCEFAQTPTYGDCDGVLAKLVGDVKGTVYAPIRFEISDETFLIGVLRFQEKSLQKLKL